MVFYGAKSPGISPSWSMVEVTGASTLQHTTKYHGLNLGAKLDVALILLLALIGLISVLKNCS